MGDSYRGAVSPRTWDIVSGGGGVGGGRRGDSGGCGHRLIGL